MMARASSHSARLEGYNSTKNAGGPTLKKSSSKVSFDESVTKCIIFTEESSSNRNEGWYSPDEISKFRQAQRGDANGDTEQRNSLLRKDFVRSILSIQSEHRAMGIVDPKGLRQMSRAASKKSMMDAIDRAKEEIENL